MSQLDLTKDYREFIALLNSHKVEFLVVGAWAVCLHGHPRYTGDLDIFVRKSPENARNLFAALKDFGFGSVGLSELDFLSPNKVVQLGYAPNRIDLLTDLSGVDFEQAWSKRESITHRGLEIPHISRDDLIRNKRATGRAKDLADIENLLTHATISLDKEKERDRDR